MTTFQGKDPDTATYSYTNPDDPCQLSSVTHSNSDYPTEQYEYDAAGNLKADASGRQFTYDTGINLGYLSSVNKDKFFYDAANRIINEGDTTLVYRGSSLVNQSQGNDTIRFVGGGAAQVRTGENAGVWLSGSEANGSVLSVDNANADTKHYDIAYSPYGETPSDQKTPSAIGYNGQRKSDLLDGYHLGNGYRLYQPSLRRFTSPDSMSPFGLGGINPYAYCAGDPINNTDPTGHIDEGEMIVEFELIEEFEQLEIAETKISTYAGRSKYSFVINSNNIPTVDDNGNSAASSSIYTAGNNNGEGSSSGFRPMKISRTGYDKNRKNPFSRTPNNKPIIRTDQVPEPTSSDKAKRLNNNRFAIITNLPDGVDIGVGKPYYTRYRVFYVDGIERTERSGKNTTRSLMRVRPLSHHPDQMLGNITFPSSPDTMRTVMINYGPAYGMEAGDGSLFGPEKDGTPSRIDKNTTYLVWEENLEVPERGSHNITLADVRILNQPVDSRNPLLAAFSEALIVPQPAYNDALRQINQFVDQVEQRVRDGFRAPNQ